MESFDRVRSSFARQTFLRSLGATLGNIAPGLVEVVLPASASILNGHGGIHPAAIAAILDAACTNAALTTVGSDRDVVTVESKTNYLQPAQGERLVAVGRVLRAGLPLVICTAEVHAVQGGRQRLVCAMQATLMVESRAAA
jgi:uncharacterized protein (TIGR00369 family)